MTISRLDGNAVVGSDEWSGVAYVHDGHIAGSAVLLKSGLHLLTAAHVADSLDRSSASVDFQTADGVVHARIASITSYPSASVGDSGVYNDLAIITLEQAAPVGVERYGLYAGLDEVGQAASIVGYGQLQSPSGTVLAPAGTIHVGSNRIDADGSVLQPLGWSASLSDQLVFDYDNGLSSRDSFGTLFGLYDTGIAGEAMITSGDSGGGLFLESDGTWLLAGINSYVRRVDATDVNSLSDGSVGDIGAATRVSSYAEWIMDTAGMSQKPVAGQGAPPVASSVPLTVAEGGGVWFLVQLFADANAACSVEFRTVDGTATAGIDYIPTSGVLQVDVGDRWAKIWVQTLADNQLEQPETFFLEIFNPQNASLPEGQLTLRAMRTITDSGSIVGVTDLVPELFG